VLLPLRVLLLLGLVMSEVAGWFSRSLRRWGQGPLAPNPKALVLLVFLQTRSSIVWSEALLRQRLSGRDSAGRIRASKPGFRCAEAAIIVQGVLGVLGRVLERVGWGLAGDGAESGPIVTRRGPWWAAPGRGLDGMLWVVY